MVSRGAVGRDSFSLVTKTVNHPFGRCKSYRMGQYECSPDYCKSGYYNLPFITAPSRLSTYWALGMLHQIHHTEAFNQDFPGRLDGYQFPSSIHLRIVLTLHLKYIATSLTE